MVIKIIRLASINAVAHGRVGVERGAEVNTVHLAQLAIKLRAGGCARNQADPVFLPIVMGGFHLLGQGHGHGLGVACASKTAGAHYVTVSDQLCRGLCRANLATQRDVPNALCHERPSCFFFSNCSEHTKAANHHRVPAPRPGPELCTIWQWPCPAFAFSGLFPPLKVLAPYAQTEASGASHTCACVCPLQKKLASTVPVFARKAYMKVRKERVWMACSRIPGMTKT